jgi:hypothetical protein
MKAERTAWAIKACHYIGAKGKDREVLSNFLGVFNFINDMPATCQDGSRIALFRTRQQARDALKLMYYKRYTVVRVKVTIEEVGNGKE